MITHSDSGFLFRGTQSMDVRGGGQPAPMASYPRLELNWIRRVLCSLICNRFNEGSIVMCVFVCFCALVLYVCVCVTAQRGFLLYAPIVRSNQGTFYFHHHVNLHI